VIRTELKKEIKREESHLPHFSSPNSIPLIITNVAETAINMNDKTKAIILNHHGNVNDFFFFLFLSSTCFSFSSTCLLVGSGDFISRIC
jgi:hypothetical protein